jgi:hypothetical protein
MEDQTMDEAAVTMHEVFLSLQRAGFTEKQAFELVLRQFEAAAYTTESS